MTLWICVDSASISIDGTLRTTGLLRTGSETGTSEAPQAGVVPRRINSFTTTNGSIDARAHSSNFGTLDFVWDGSNAGFKLLNDEGDFYSAACMGVNASGASVNKVIPDTSAASTQVYLDSDVMVYISCSFGDPFLSGRAVTQLTLERRGNLATNWVGYVTSTLNQ